MRFCLNAKPANTNASNKPTPPKSHHKGRLVAGDTDQIGHARFSDLERRVLIDQASGVCSGPVKPRGSCSSIELSTEIEVCRRFAHTIVVVGQIQGAESFQAVGCRRCLD